MSVKCLGETYDIHGGEMETEFSPRRGNDNFAVGIRFTGKPFAKYWLQSMG